MRAPRRAQLRSHRDDRLRVPTIASEREMVGTSLSLLCPPYELREDGAYFDRCIAGFSVDFFAAQRLCAVLISAMCVSAWGKFPVWRPAAGRYLASYGAAQSNAQAAAEALGLTGG